MFFFSTGAARSAAVWPPVDCACVPQLFNSWLTPSFVHLFSGNLSANFFAVYFFKYKLFIKILSSSLNTMLIVDKHCSDVRCYEFPVPQIDCKCKKVKEHWLGKYYLQSVWGKTRYFKQSEAIKMQFVFLFFPHLQKIWIFIFPR